jgi:LemA protein
LSVNGGSWAASTTSREDLLNWFVIILAALVVGAVLIYNSLVRLRVRVQGAWADIDVQLKRRYDLIPNLVETVKGYAGHERETLEAVINARNRAMSATGPADKAAAENMLTGALKSLFALSEAYPQLRAVESFTGLQESLEEIETAVQNARRYYNAVVRDYNTKIDVFPSNMVANAFRFQKEEFFELTEEAEREAPKVSFGEDGP